MPVKVLKLRIIKPYNSPNESDPVTWSALENMLYDLRYATAKMANYVIQRNCQIEFSRLQYKEKYGRYPSITEYTELTYCYPALTKMFPQIASQIVNQTEQAAKKVWKSTRKEVLNFRQSIPSFKLNFPIIIHNKSYSITAKTSQYSTIACHPFQYVINASLGSKQTERHKYMLLVDVGDKYKQEIMNHIIDGTYSKCAMQIIGKKMQNKRAIRWFCLIPYKFNVDINTRLDKNRIMGITLGVNKAVYWAFSDSSKRGWIDGYDISEFSRRLRARKGQMIAQMKYCGSGRIGHGLNRRLKPIISLQEKLSNFRDTTNHRYAKHIIDIALQNKCGVIQMERLSILNKKNIILKNWRFFDLQKKIEDKASAVGISVIKVNPLSITQRCNKCGHINAMRKDEQANFICAKCGYGKFYQCSSCGHIQKEPGICMQCNSFIKQVHIDTDYNTAKNLSIVDIERIIAQTL